MTCPNATSTSVTSSRIWPSSGRSRRREALVRRQPSIGGAPSPRPAPSLRPHVHPIGGAAGRASRHLPRVTSPRLRRHLRPLRHVRPLLVLALLASLAAPVSANASTNLSPPSLSGSTVVDATLVASPGAWSGSPDFATLDLYVCARADCADATLRESYGVGYPSTYPTGPLVLGYWYRLVVTTHEPGVGWSAPAASAIVGPVLPHPPAATTAPTVSAWPQDGADAVATTGGWTNGGAPGEPTLALRWQRCDAAGGACADIPGAAAASYRAGAADVGRRLRVVATGTNAGGATSAASAPSGPVAPRSTVPPALHGTAADGQLLAVDAGAWNGVSGLDLTYAWQRCSAAGTPCTPIAGATASTYTTGPVDVGSALRAVVSATASGSQATAATSAATSPIAPRATGDPSIAGVARDGVVLTASSGSWNGAAGLAFGYRWLRCEADGGSCVDLPGASSASYAATPVDVGATLRVRVTADANGGRTSSVSAPTAVVAPRPPEPVDPPLVSGSARDGATLAATAGTWLGTAPLALARQWLRCDVTGDACLALPGATGPTYELAASDVGARLRVRVTAANAGGSAAVLSAPTAVVEALRPASGAPPVVSGAAVDGGTLAASGGSWSGTAPLALARQWLRCDADGAGCVAIGGADGSTLLLGADDVGHRLRVRVTASNAAGSASVTSTSSGVVLGAAPRNVAAPAIDGDPVAGAKLTATPGVWQGAVGTVTYQWQRCDRDLTACGDIAGATVATHGVRVDDVDHRLRVRVAATSGGGTTTATSGATAAVRAAEGTPPPRTEPNDGADGRDGRDGRDAVPPPPQTGDPAPVTVTASFDRPVVTGAAAALVRGRVTGRDAVGRTVEVQLRHAFGGRNAIARGVVGPQGGFAIAVRPRVTSVAVVTVLGADGAAAARMTTAPLRVRPVLRARFARGAAGLRVTGTLAPGGGPAVRLVWQRRASPRGGWQAICRPLAVDRAGRFAGRCAGERPSAGARYRVAYVAQPGGSVPGGGVGAGGGARLSYTCVRAPASRNASTASTRRWSACDGGSSSFAKTFFTCFSTAPSPTPRAVAIATFERPSAISPSTSSSRGVRPDRRSPPRRRPSSCATTSGSMAVPPAATSRRRSTNVDTSATRSLSRYPTPRASRRSRRVA